MTRERDLVIYLTVMISLFQRFIVSAVLFTAPLVWSAPPLAQGWKTSWPFGELSRVNEPALGTNIGWQQKKFGEDLGAEFDPEFWRSRLKLVKSGGMSVARVWIFEKMQGLIFDSSYRLTAIDPLVLDHVRDIAVIAKEEGVQIYWTFFDGNVQWGKLPEEQSYYKKAQSVFQNWGNNREQFIDLALKPLFRVFTETKSTFAVDLLNEVQGAYWNRSGRDWEGVRGFLTRLTQISHQMDASIPLTASTGWTGARSDLTAGVLKGVGLDFYDIHVYDKNSFSGVEDCRRWRESLDLPVLMGEFAPVSWYRGREKLEQSLLELYELAQGCGMVGALTWRLEELYYPSHSMLVPGTTDWSPHVTELLRRIKTEESFQETR